MKDYVNLSYDKSCSFFYWLFHQEKCFGFPVVYADGWVSRLKSSANKRKPLGILCNGYIVSVWDIPMEMTPQEAKDYCYNSFIAGRRACVPPRKVMRKLLYNIRMVNEMIHDLGGNKIESKWYMATNDQFTTSPSGYPYDDIMLGICLEHLDDYAGKGGIVCWEIGPFTLAAFYPAVKI